jgi:hypothetical protein
VCEKLCFCILDTWTVGDVLSASLCLARLAVATSEPQIIEISGKAGSGNRSDLLFLYAIFRLRRITSCRHDQPMSLNRTTGGKSTSFEWRMNLPMGRLLQIRSFNPSCHQHLVCNWERGLRTLRLRSSETEDAFICSSLSKCLWSKSDRITELQI